MHKTVPPLRGLIAFAATARHASFKLAAEELNVTPGAVSQQVQKLEEWLGFALFTRQVRQLQITDRGMGYYSRIAPALDQITTVSESYRRSASDSVRLSLSQTLAAKWLSPRLGHFLGLHPGFEVHVNASNQPVDFHREQVDLALRYFDGNDPALTCELIYHDEVRAFCAPEYRQRMALEQPDQLAGMTLIVASLYPYWDDWLNAFTSLDAEAKKTIPKLYFDQALLAINAAKQGQGMVLSNYLLVQEDLESGALIEPFNLSIPLNKGYYLVHPANQPLGNAAAALKGWIVEQSLNL